MARPKNETLSPFGLAVKHCATVLADHGDPCEIAVKIAGAQMVANNGTLAAGAIIPDAGLTCCPHGRLLLTALENAKSQTAMETNGEALRVTSSAGLSIVPCYPMDGVLPTWPDSPVAPLPENFRDALNYVAKLAKENSQTILEASITILPNSVMATNRHVIIEAQTNAQIQCGAQPLTVPKLFVTALAKLKKKITYYGFTAGSSFTVFFDDNSFLKTMVYQDELPNNMVSYFDHAPQHDADPEPLPKKFFEGVDAVRDFNDEATIRINSLEVRAQEGGTGSKFKLTKMPRHLKSRLDENQPEIGMNAKYIDLFRGVNDLSIRFDHYDRVSMLWGTLGKEETLFHIRGAICHVDLAEAPAGAPDAVAPTQPPPPQETGWGTPNEPSTESGWINPNLDDEIPF